MEKYKQVPLRAHGETEARDLDTSEYMGRKHRLIATVNEMRNNPSIPKPSPFGRDIVSPHQFDQSVGPRGRMTDIGPDIFHSAVTTTLTSSARAATSHTDQTSANALQSALGYRRPNPAVGPDAGRPAPFRAPSYHVLVGVFPPVPREQVLAMKPKEAFFSKLTPRSQMVFKLLASFNKAVIYRTDNGPDTVDLRSSVALLPRYGDGSLQPWNIVIEQGGGELEAYSLLAFKGKLGEEAFLLKDWRSSLAQDAFYMYHIPSESFYSYASEDAEPHLVLPWSDEYRLAELLLGRCGGVFKARLDAYEAAIAAQLPVKRKVVEQELKREAVIWYITDLEKQQATTWHLTTSRAIPKLGQYRGPLSRHTGRKMIPHDRSEHKNRRYNADGTVRLEWEVAATKVNGGVEARHGAQISDIITTQSRSHHD